MQWYPVSSLVPNKLVFLLFDGLQTTQWVGYVNNDGVCEWPAKVKGLRPSGWQDVLVDLTRLKAVGER